MIAAAPFCKPTDRISPVPLPDHVQVIGYGAPRHCTRTGGFTIQGKTNLNRTVEVTFPRHLAAALVHDFANLLTTEQLPPRRAPRAYGPPRLILDDGAVRAGLARYLAGYESIEPIAESLGVSKGTLRARFLAIDPERCAIAGRLWKTNRLSTEPVRLARFAQVMPGHRAPILKSTGRIL